MKLGLMFGLREFSDEPTKKTFIIVNPCIVLLRLRYDTKYDNTFTLSHEFLRRIWTPDTYFPDSLSSSKQDVMTPNVLVRLHPDGSILYSARVTILAKCPMKLHYFPMDMQVLKLILALNDITHG